MPEVAPPAGPELPTEALHVPLRQIVAVPPVGDATLSVPAFEVVPMLTEPLTVASSAPYLLPRPSAVIHALPPPDLSCDVAPTFMGADTSAKGGVPFGSVNAHAWRPAAQRMTAASTAVWVKRRRALDFMEGREHAYRDRPRLCRTVGAGAGHGEGR